MLFSDIEGSTALLRRLGDRYGEALFAQRALMRAAISDSRGLEMGTEGDSFYVAFESAGDAVRCCLAGQGALAGYDWPGGVAVRRPDWFAGPTGMLCTERSRKRSRRSVQPILWFVLLFGARSATLCPT